jgi:hypothetical protein
MTPTLSHTIGQIIRAAGTARHTAIPGRVTVWNSGEMTATVQPTVSRAHRNAAGVRVSTLPRPIPRVPVIMWGLFRELSPGDHVLLIVSESAIDQWWVTGQSGDPADDRHGELEDAIAIPGLHSRPGTPAFRGEPTFRGDTYELAFKTLIEAIASAAAGTGGPVTTAINAALNVFLNTPGRFTTSKID